MEICGIYKITNKITGDCYIGSSNNVKLRWAVHRCPSTWKKCPNNSMYIDMRKYGVDKFEFQILEEVEEGKLKVAEQKFIELLKPAYNQMNANGLDIERYKKTKKESQKEYQKSDKGKETQKKYQKSDKGKESQKKYNKSDKGKESKKKYNSQLCCYNCETLTLGALRTRFQRAGIPHPTLEAKKYLL